MDIVWEVTDSIVKRYDFSVEDKNNDLYKMRSDTKSRRLYNISKVDKTRNDHNKGNWSYFMCLNNLSQM